MHVGGKKWSSHGLMVTQMKVARMETEQTEQTVGHQPSVSLMPRESFLPFIGANSGIYSIHVEFSLSSFELEPVRHFKLWAGHALQARAKDVPLRASGSKRCAIRHAAAAWHILAPKFGVGVVCGVVCAWALIIIGFAVYFLHWEHFASLENVFSALGLGETP